MEANEEPPSRKQGLTPIGSRYETRYNRLRPQGVVLILSWAPMVSKGGIFSVNDFRKQVGIILRLPVVVVLGILWVVLLWWWIVLFAMIGTSIALIGVPLTYPFVYAVEWIRLAFLNSNDPTCPDHFDGYPDNYLKWTVDAIKLGFPTLNGWIFQRLGLALVRSFI